MWIVCQQTIHMKYQALFDFIKQRQKKIQNDVKWLQIINGTCEV